MALSSEPTLKILWTQDQLEGPVNGLALYEGEKLWFRRMHTAEPVDFRRYALLRISEDQLKMVEDDHHRYCEEMQSPFHHGDPRVLRKKTSVHRGDLKAMMPEGKSFIEVPMAVQGMVLVKQYVHLYNPDQIEGEIVKEVPESEFSNYNVPQRVIWEE